METCERCGAWYVRSRNHICPPAWTVYVDFTDPLYDGPGADTTVYAANAEIAAMKWAEEWDPDHDMVLAQDEDTTVTIVVFPMGQPDRPTKLTVSAVHVIEYQVSGEDTE